MLIPLAGVVFAAANRHPIAGIAAAFAGVSGGFSANLIQANLNRYFLVLLKLQPRVLIHPGMQIWLVIGTLSAE